MANLTLSIDDETLKRARIRALELDASVNALVREYLTALVSNERELAQSGLLRLIDGSEAGGEASARSWSRDELYEERIAETRRHAELIEGCIERLGGNVSTMQGVTGVVGAGLQSAMAALTGDDLVKASLAGYASEHLEIASYQALIAAANDLGDKETAAVCEQILDEELAMSAWLEENQPEVVLHFLHAD